MEIDRAKPLDICRIETCSFVKHKAHTENISTNKAMQLAADELGVPFGTIKNWVYPAGTEKRNESRRKQRELEGCMTGHTTPLPDNLANLENLEEIIFERKKEIAKEINEPTQHKRKNAQFRTSFSGENEWYTPLIYIDAVRQVLGEIDLDPATSEFGQDRIRAKHYFTPKENGLVQPWIGKIYLNPPYSQPLIAQFIEKAVEEYGNKHVTEAIVLTHNYTDTKWFHQIETVAACICFTLGRVRFEKSDGQIASPTQGSAFFYLGSNPEKFRQIFEEFGFVR